MKLIVRSRNVLVSKALQEHCEVRVQRAFEPFAGHVACVEVVFADLNGPKKGLGYACKVFVERVGGGWVMFDATARDYYLAASRATAGAARHLARQLGRSRTYTRPRSLPLDAA